MSRPIIGLTCARTVPCRVTFRAALKRKLWISSTTETLVGGWDAVKTVWITLEAREVNAIAFRDIQLVLDVFARLPNRLVQYICSEHAAEARNGTGVTDGCVVLRGRERNPGPFRRHAKGAA